MKIITPIRHVALTSMLAVIPLLYPSVLRVQAEEDSFVKTEIISGIPPQGTSNIQILKSAPNPEVNIMGNSTNAIIVVDLSKNVLYKYDENGFAEKAYSIASGKETTPTSTGLRVVSHVEKYPYRTAPKSTKRRKSPNDYGPKIIILNKIDPSTGATSLFGEFIHGNNNPNSIGKYVSNGCMRMDNDVITELATQVHRGDIVKIIR